MTNIFEKLFQRRRCLLNILRAETNIITNQLKGKFVVFSNRYRGDIISIYWNEECDEFIIELDDDGYEDFIKIYTIDKDSLSKINIFDTKEEALLFAEVGGTE